MPVPSRNRLSARGRLLLSAGLILAAIAAQFVILTFFPGSPHSQRVLLGHPPLLAATELGITICWALLMTILDGPQESLRRLFATAFSYVSHAKRSNGGILGCVPPTVPRGCDGGRSLRPRRVGNPDCMSPLPA
jgi:hypothetical protein